MDYPAGLIHYNVSSIKMDARWSCFFHPTSQHGLFFGQWAVLLYLHGNGSTSDFKQSSQHACTKHINYLPPVHTVAYMLTSCLAVQVVVSPPPHAIQINGSWCCDGENCTEKAALIHFTPIMSLILRSSNFFLQSLYIQMKSNYIR